MTSGPAASEPPGAADEHVPPGAASEPVPEPPAASGVPAPAPPTVLARAKALWCALVSGLG